MDEGGAARRESLSDPADQNRLSLDSQNQEGDPLGPRPGCLSRSQLDPSPMGTPEPPAGRSMKENPDPDQNGPNDPKQVRPDPGSAQPEPSSTPDSTRPGGSLQKEPEGSAGPEPEPLVERSSHQNQDQGAEEELPAGPSEVLPAGTEPVRLENLRSVPPSSDDLQLQNLQDPSDLHQNQDPAPRLDLLQAPPPAVDLAPPLTIEAFCDQVKPRPPGSSPGEPKLCGYLQKQAGPLRAWKLRWFSYEDQKNQLFYYRTPQDVMPLGRVELNGATFTFPLKAEGGTFHIKTPERTFILKVGSAELLRSG